MPLLIYFVPRDNSMFMLLFIPTLVCHFVSGAIMKGGVVSGSLIILFLSLL